MQRVRGRSERGQPRSLTLEDAGEGHVFIRGVYGSERPGPAIRVQSAAMRTVINEAGSATISGDSTTAASHVFVRRDYQGLYLWIQGTLTNGWSVIVDALQFERALNLESRGQ